MTDTTLPKKTRKSPVPANYDRIKAGALNLELKQRVELKNALADSITGELELMEQTFEASKKLVNGGQ